MEMDGDGRAVRARSCPARDLVESPPAASPANFLPRTVCEQSPIDSGAGSILLAQGPVPSQDAAASSHTWSTRMHLVELRRWWPKNFASLAVRLRRAYAILIVPVSLNAIVLNFAGASTGTLVLVCVLGTISNGQVLSIMLI